MGEHVQFVATNDRTRELVQNLSHERDVLQKLIEITRPDDVFWDVGACLGIHSFFLAKHLTNGEVVSFEPMPTNRGVLMDNKSVNELSNIHVSKNVLADENGTVEFAIRESFEAGYGRHGVDIGDYDKLHSIEATATTGDSLVMNGDLPMPNIVKIDVEGAGPLTLKGMENILARDACRAVFFETHEPNPVQPSHEDLGYSVDDIIDLFNRYGFDVSTLDRDYHLFATKETGDSLSLADATLDISLIQGDIARQSADALVNSAGTTLRMGSGVAGALREHGGEQLHRDAIKQGPVKTGDVVATDAYDLRADYVIHAASMPHHGAGASSQVSVRQATRNALRKADALGCESIVIPAIGCGLGGLSLVTGAEVILDELAHYTPEHNLDDVRFITYSDDEYQTIQTLVGGDS